MTLFRTLSGEVCSARCVEERCTFNSDMHAVFKRWMYLVAPSGKAGAGARPEKLLIDRCEEPALSLPIRSSAVCTASGFLALP